MRCSVVVTSAADSSQNLLDISSFSTRELSKRPSWRSHFGLFFSSCNVFLPDSLISPDNAANNVDSQSCSKRKKKKTTKTAER